MGIVNKIKLPDNTVLEIRDKGAVRYDSAQLLSSAQKERARTNTDSQTKLVSGENIKTINNQSLLGSGNIEIDPGQPGLIDDVRINNESIVTNRVANIETEDVNPLVIGDIISHDADEFATAAQGTKAETALQPAALNSYRTATDQNVIDDALSGRTGVVESKIPSQATAQNQLADKEFVNSSIATATATFRGTSVSGLTEAQFLAWANGLTKDNNDYVFWNTADSAGNTQFKKYKYNGSAWVYEYTLNNSTFTAAQWSTINSGLTSSDKTALNNALALIATFGNIVTHNTSEFATSAQGAKAETALQPSALNPYRTSAAQDTIDTAIKNRLDTIESKEEGWDAKLSDAPADGKQYARKDGAWSEVEAGGSEAIIIPIVRDGDSYKTTLTEQEVDDIINRYHANPNMKILISSEDSVYTPDYIYRTDGGTYKDVEILCSQVSMPINSDRQITNESMWVSLWSDTDAEYREIGQSYISMEKGRVPTDAPYDENQYVRQNKRWVKNALTISSGTISIGQFTLSSTSGRTYQVCDTDSWRSITLSGGNANPGYEHYALFRNTGSYDCVITPASSMIAPSTITVKSGKYVEISWIYNGSYVIVTSSSELE